MPKHSYLYIKWQACPLYHICGHLFFRLIINNLECYVGHTAQIIAVSFQTKRSEFPQFPPLMQIILIEYLITN